MFYRVRTRLPDTPGALATLAQRCGDEGVNILGLQIYPDLGSVTDDLVIKVPDAWTPARVVDLVASAGGSEISVSSSTAYELQDQPTRWLTAVRALIDDPSRLGSELTALVGARLSLSATEEVRVAALTEIAEALAQPAAPARTFDAVVEYDEDESEVRARVGSGIVGAGSFVTTAADGSAEGFLEVAPAWRRMGVGRQLLRRLCQRAAGLGLAELVILAPPGEAAVVPLISAAGMRGRVRMTEAGIQVRLNLVDVRPVSASA
jgi:GNAT superfamily N-acetyltransferase